MTTGAAEPHQQKKQLAQALLTPDGQPIGFATDVETCTVRIESEFINPKTGNIPVWDIDERVRERVMNACEFDSDAADEYWDIQLLLRTDVSARERFRMQLEAVHHKTPFTSSDEYTKEQPLVFTPQAGTNTMSVAALVVPEDMPPKSFGHFLADMGPKYGLRGKRLYDTFLKAAVTVDPALPQKFLRNPRDAQAQFYSVLLEDEDVIRDVASSDHGTTVIGVEETSSAHD